MCTVSQNLARHFTARSKIIVGIKGETSQGKKCDEE